MIPPKSTPDPRLAPDTRYGRIWRKMVVRRERRLVASSRTPRGTPEGERWMALHSEAFNLGMRFLGTYKLGAWSEPRDVPPWWQGGGQG